MHRHSKQFKIYIASSGKEIDGLCEKYLIEDVPEDTEHCFTNTLLNLIFIYMYMDRSAINITALVTVSVDNKTVCLSFIVYINSQQPGIVYIKTSI